MDAWGQLGLFFGMGQAVVGHVDEIGLTGPYPLGKTDGLFDGHMRRMRPVVEGIDHEGVNTFEVWPLAVGQTAHVGDVG